MVVTSYGRNKNRDDEMKNQEKANNSPSYRCAPINNLVKKNLENKFIHFIPRHSRHRKDNESAETKIHPPE